MFGELERISKKAVVAYSRRYLDICLEEVRTAGVSATAALTRLRRVTTRDDAAKRSLLQESDGTRWAGSPVQWATHVTKTSTLIAWNRVLYEKLTVTHLAKKFPVPSWDQKVHYCVHNMYPSLQSKH